MWDSRAWLVLERRDARLEERCSIELGTRYDGEMEAAVQHEQSIIDEIEWVMRVGGC